MKSKTVLLYPLATEKSIRQIELENKITFIVSEKATKNNIKKSFEKQFNVEVKKVNTLNDFKGRKKAIITLKPTHNALDIASELGIM